MATERVGIRELRQNLSVYIRKVLRGQRFEVTDRGRSVALLTPLPASSSNIESLVLAGRLRRPVGRLSDLGPPKGRASNRLSEALEEERREQNLT